MSYTISELEQLSGISVHNIRIWERRYQALQPERTSGNVRYYDDDQLRRLLNITGLYYAGHKISKACAMSSEDMEKNLQAEIELTIATENQFEYYISQIVSNGLLYKEHEVKKLIQRCLHQHGVLDTYKYMIYPLLVRIGLMWRQNSLCPSQEHFLSSIFRQKLFAAIDNCAEPSENAEKWLLFMPEDEDHDIGLLLASYLLRITGKKVIYLGSKVPYSALKNTANTTNPTNLLFFMTRLRPVGGTQDYVTQLVKDFPSKNIFVSGNPRVLGEVRFPNHFHWLKEISDFEKLLKLQETNSLIQS